MIQVMKWLLVGAFGYFLYSVIRGIDMTPAEGRGNKRAQGKSRRPARINRNQNLTGVLGAGRGTGRDEIVEDPNGAEHHTRVGRGVLR